jgi:diguanylate cyclase (GGDEF)-like protein
VAEKTTHQTDKRLQLLVGLVAVAACAVLLVMSWWYEWDLGLLNGSAAGLTVLVAVTSGASPRVRIRAIRIGLASTELAVMVGLATLRPITVIWCTALGVAIAKGVIRQRFRQLIFNTGKGTLAAGAAALAAETIVGLNHGHHIGYLLASLAVAGLAYTVVNEALVVPALAFASRTPMRQRMLANWDVRLGQFFAWILLAFGGVLVLWQNSALIVIVPLVALSLQLWYGGRLRARGERDAWQQLAQSTDEFNAVDLDGVLKTAVKRAADLFSADEVDVEVTVHGPPRLVRGGTDGITYDGPPADAPPTTGESTANALEGHDGGTNIGELRLRFRGQVKLTDREDYTLQTFASALCTAVRNAAAYAELARLADQHAHDAAHDPLTGLPNRRRLQEEGKRALEARPVRGVIALLLVDLNHFKEINDTLGHAAGDVVLKEVGMRLKEAAGAEDIVARLGGDEFAVLLKGLTAPAVAGHRAQLMLATLAEPIELEGMRISVEASIGIASAPSKGGMGELMRRADIAMYQAKRGGQRIATYARARDTADISRLALGGDLPRAVAEQEITVKFQPIVDLASGEVVAAEALARWQHPDKGPLDPRRFLEAVERSGLLPAFTDAVLDQALVAANTWREADFDLPVAVNVSPRSLLDRRFPAAVAARLRAHDYAPDQLFLELTESLTLSQLEVVDEVLNALHDQGIRLALDDFGTGYSSLATLSRVPVHELKIDLEFIRAMETSAEAAAVVRSTVDLGRSLDLAVVAEGVESESQRRTLWELGCQAGQGHLFSRPVASSHLLNVLRRGTGGRPGTLAPPLHEEGTVIRIPTARRAGEREGGERLPHWPA